MGKANDRRLSKHALEEVYRNCGVLVLRRCRLILGDQSEAEDMLQETFCRLLRYGDFQRADQVSLAWLYRIAERCCFDHLRKSKRSAAWLANGDRQTKNLINPDRRVLAAEQIARLLPKDDLKLQQIALMHFVDGLTQKEMAAQLGWSRRTIGKKLAKLRQRIHRVAGLIEAPDG